MSLLLILPILVSGFIFCNKHPLIFFKLHRYEGQYLYLQSAKFGLISLLIALPLNCSLLWALSLPISHFHFRLGPSYIHAITNYLDSSNLVLEGPAQAAWIFSTSILMLALPYLSCSVYKRYKMWTLKLSTDGQLLTAIQYEILKDSPMDKLLLISLLQKKQILLSMSDRKVYVGVVTSTSEPNEADSGNQEISIKPILSGYRDKDNLTISFTTDYKDLAVDISLTIKQELIVSATYFDFGVYEEFSKRRAEAKVVKNPLEASLNKLAEFLKSK